jgi:hypothetical protein
MDKHEVKPENMDAAETTNESEEQLVVEVPVNVRAGLGYCSCCEVRSE